ncbi:hypothetical protein UFOVP1608_26 [uncultured Caudovirales phage]|uniref:Uncharacterized protein n=1 Tax=uncultured Caudovirales phage TaxID=2100421 RepID=A0A6J5SS89_9CAUD|nr:hypothetical protein UFOVP1608_26 [uncultured Caudovirales phage]
MERLLAGQPGTLTFNLYDEDGALTDVDVDTDVTVSITDSAELEVNTGTATAPVDPTVGVYTYVVPKTVTADLDTYTVEWTFTLDAVERTISTQFESVGGHLFEIADFRAVDSVLVDADAYPSAKIRQARVNAEQTIETAAHVAFVPRVSTRTLSGDNTTTLVVPDSHIRSIYSVSIDDVDLTEGEMLYVEIEDSGIIKRTDGNLWTDGFKNIVIRYEHGWDAPPERIRKAAMLLAYEALVPSQLNPRATSQSTDLGEFRISVANMDKDRFTGIPEVDAAIMQFGSFRPSVG